MFSEEYIKKGHEAGQDDSQASQVDEIGQSSHGSTTDMDAVAEWREKYLHLNADFQNYQRRQEKERGLWMHGAQAHVFKELLTIVGDFDRALAQPVAEESIAQWRAGFDMIHASLYKLLAKFDVTEVAQYETFDPEIHEAIAMVAAEGKSAGSIVDVVEKGFMFKGQVLRPAKVTVAQ